MKILNRFLFAIAWVASLAFTSCYAYLIDWEATPETDIVQIPQEGGRYYFENFESKKVAQHECMIRERFLSVCAIA